MAKQIRLICVPDLRRKHKNRGRSQTTASQNMLAPDSANVRRFRVTLSRRLFPKRISVRGSAHAERNIQTGRWKSSRSVNVSRASGRRQLFCFLLIPRGLKRKRRPRVIFSPRPGKNNALTFQSGRAAGAEVTTVQARSDRFLERSSDSARAFSARPAIISATSLGKLR